MTHLISKITTRHIALTNNLTRCYIRCDNHCPRCGEPDESMTCYFKMLTICTCMGLIVYTFEPKHFLLVSSVYTNLDYLLWRKNRKEDTQLDRYPYPLIIWYLYKIRNDKLIKRIDKELSKLIWYVEGAICLQNICMVDGSWNPTSI